MTSRQLAHVIAGITWATGLAVADGTIVLAAVLMIALAHADNIALARWDGVIYLQ